MRPRVLLLQPSLLPFGGGNSVAVWMIEALKHDHDITLLGWDPVDFNRINHAYGTDLRPGDFEIRLVPRWAERFRKLARVRGALLQRYLMLRWGRPLAKQFDVTLSVNGEIDVDAPAIQYVHYPWGYLPRPEQDLRWFHKFPGVLPLYYAAGSLLAPVSEATIRENLTLVNSDWTGARFRKRYGGTTTTLYPPVFGAQHPISWHEREATFVAIGRIAPEKNLPAAIEIIERVRSRGHDVRLRIIGGASPRERCYREIAALARTRPWVELHVNPSKDELLSLVARSRFGIHAMEDEHFGIAIAEMTLSGTIPFVPDSGGPPEIVAGETRVLFRSVEDAAEKIDAVLRSQEIQDALRESLTAAAQRFLYPAFRERFRGIVAEFLERHANPQRTVAGENACAIHSSERADQASQSA